MKEKKQNKIGKKILLPMLLIFLMLLVLLIYRRLDTQKDDIQKDSDVNQAIDQLEVANYKDRLPDNYPEDLSIYEGSEIVSASASDTSVSVMWKTMDSIDNVRRHYDQALKDKDWEYEVSETDEAVMYKLNKDGTTGFMVITNEDGFTTITVAVGLE